MADVTLSKAVRSNLLNLQSTANSMSKTQERLATGLKVNSALDNPTNFFTASSLNSRAGDLSALLDSIGQATNTLDAATNGIDSLTELVQSAKSIAQQARQATGPTNTYSSLDASANTLGATNLNGSESTATFTGANTSARSNELEAKTINIAGKTVAPESAASDASANTAALGNRLDAQATTVTGAAITETIGTTSGAGGTLNTGIGAPANGETVTFNATVNGASVTYNVTFDNTVQTDQATTIAALGGASDGGGGSLSDNFTITANGANDITITANTADASLTIDAGSGANALSALGLSTDGSNSVTSSSLLDQLETNDPAIAGKNLTIGGTDAVGNSIATQTITFGNGVGEVSTLAELDTALGAAQAAVGGAFTAGVNGSNRIEITQAAGTKSSITIGGDAKDVASNATLLEGSAGTLFDTHNSTATIEDLGESLAASAGGPFNISSPTLSFDINGTTTSVTLAATDRVDDVINKLSADGTLSASLTFTKTSDADGDHIQIDSKDERIDFTVNANQTSAALGLTSDNTTDNVQESDSLFTRLKAEGAVEGDTIVISGTNANGSTIAEQTITFGNGAGQVKSLDDLNTALNTAATAAGGGFSAAISGDAISITKPLGTEASITVGGTLAANTTAAALLETNPGDVFGTHNSQPTLADIGAAKGYTDLATGGALNITVNGTNYNIGVSSDDRIDDVIAKLSNASVASKLDFTKSTDGAGHDHIKVDAKDASVDFTINANQTSDALGLTTDATTATTGDSTSLLDLVDTAFGAAGLGQGKTLTVAVNGGIEQKITFGTGKDEVQTLDQFNTKLSTLSGVTASVSDTGALSIAVESGTAQTSLTIGGTAATKLGLTAGTQTGEVIETTANATRDKLKADFNTILSQIDDLSKDASYNGINLLNGDDLKVTFNEKGSSSLTIDGVKFDSNNLGLTNAFGDQFQDNDTIDAKISAIDTALTNLRSQATTFGSNLSMVETRQDFTKAMINTLETGAADLTLADSNEEAANLLALQTRQQLSSTALSLASQADQNVLRLF